MEINIYDFDKTMLPFDSGSRFWLFCLLRYPWIAVLLPYQGIFGLLMLAGIIDLKTAKNHFFKFIRFIPLQSAVVKFWNKYDKKIFDWARKENRTGKTVVISASPDFLLNEIAKRQQFDCLICTRHSKTGAVIGENCKSEEKVRRFYELFPGGKAANVYSDSIKHDKPIFSLGGNCWHIVKGERIPFDFAAVYPEKE